MPGTRRRPQFRDTLEYTRDDVIGLSKSFVQRHDTERAALTEVTFAVDPGHTTAIVGESGAGKTTLVRCIAGLEHPSAGAILIRGKRLRLRLDTLRPFRWYSRTLWTPSIRCVASAPSIAEPLRGFVPPVDGRSAFRELLEQMGIKLQNGM